MVLPDKQTQRTFEQGTFVPTLAKTFLTAKRAEGRSSNSIAFYREKLKILLAHCEAMQLTQLQDMTPDFLRLSCWP